MKKKDLIFYAGAAVLMAVSAQGVSADELVSKEVVLPLKATKSKLKQRQK